MVDESSYERTLQEYLSAEFRVLNAHLPRYKKSLAELLNEEHPHVVCTDGRAHFFKKKDLKYLAEVVTQEEQEALLLPIIIELMPGQNEVAIICEREVVAKVISEVLGMPVVQEHDRAIIYKSQLGLVRGTLRTTTQYAFSPKGLK